MPDQIAASSFLFLILQLIFLQWLSQIELLDKNLTDSYIAAGLVASTTSLFRFNIFVPQRPRASGQQVKTMSQDSSFPIQYTSEVSSPFLFDQVEPAEDVPFPTKFRDQIEVDTVHDGHIIPEELIRSPRVKPLIAQGALWKHYVRERDWGANLVAKYLVRALGLKGFNRVTTARLVMDFNRFPGSSPPDATPVNRLAIIKPFSKVLNLDEKHFVLKTYYDSVSEGMENVIMGKLIKVSVHTYDAFNESTTQRPEISLITRALAYQLNSHLPYDLFDPLFPDVLVESTCNAILRDRLAITLLKAGISVEHNYPYCAPDGSLEVRSQPWFFFQRIRCHFEEKYPETQSDPAFQRVWNMLLDTNLRDGDAEALRGFLHRYRSIPEGLAQEFHAAADSYEQIAEFLSKMPKQVKAYQSAPNRTSTLSIEVRKDLVVRFKGKEPIEPLEENARAIAEKVAEGISTYLNDDLAELTQHEGEQL